MRNVLFQGINNINTKLSIDYIGKGDKYVVNRSVSSPEI